MIVRLGEEEGDHLMNSKENGSEYIQGSNNLHQRSNRHPAMVSRRTNEWIKEILSILLSKNGLSILLSLVLIALVIVRLIHSTNFAEGMDALFFAIISVAFLVHLIPLDRLTSFKAGGFELALDHPQVEGAVQEITLRQDLSGQEDTRLRKELSRLQSELETIHGSRILWIDDNPHGIVGEKRLIRLLGIGVDTATSSEEAERILEKDNDFDLIVSDVKRGGDKHEGANFVVKLRNHPDHVIRELPVIFYSAYSIRRLADLTQPARDASLPDDYRPSVPVEITSDLYALVPKIIRLLADARLPLDPSDGRKKSTARHL